MALTDVDCTSFHPQMQSEPLVEKLRSSISLAGALFGDAERYGKYQSAVKIINSYSAQSVKTVAARMHSFLSYHNMSKRDRPPHLIERDRREESWISCLASNGHVVEKKKDDGYMPGVRGYVGPDEPNTVISEWGRVGPPKQVYHYPLPVVSSEDDLVEAWHAVFEHPQIYSSQRPSQFSMRIPEMVLAECWLKAGEGPPPLTLADQFRILKFCFPESLNHDRDPPHWHSNVWRGCEQNETTPLAVYPRWSIVWERGVRAVAFKNRQEPSKDNCDCIEEPRLI